ncbi:MAG: hypothetical protein IPH54_15655 [Rhodoferax sp.]|nr:hypothetical protein [Rhodoferax sp.]
MLSVGVVGASGLIDRAVVQSMRLRGWTVRSFGRRNADVTVDLDDLESIAQAQFGWMPWSIAQARLTRIL